MLHAINPPLHCHHQANSAYDKLAVISENIDKLREIEQFIFELKQWLRAYMDKLKQDYQDAVEGIFDSDNEWTGPNTYTNNISLKDGDIYWKDDNGNNLAWVSYDVSNQVLTFHVNNKEIQLSPTGSIAPTTNPDLNTAVVTLDYLTGLLQGYQPALDFDITPTANSTNPVTSDGIYRALQALTATIPAVVIDDTVTQASTNPVTSAGIYSFVQNLLANLNIPEEFDLSGLPVASKSVKGIMQVGDYLAVTSGLVSVDYDALLTQLKADLGIGDNSGGDDEIDYDTMFSLTTTWDVEYMTSQYVLSSHTEVPVVKSVSGNGNSYLYPTLTTADRGTTKTNVASIGDTITCKNTATQVSKKYVPLRMIITWNGSQAAGTGSGEDVNAARYTGLHIGIWFRNANYTLTSEDKTSINDDADDFLATYTGIGHKDTGALE